MNEPKKQTHINKSGNGMKRQNNFIFIYFQNHKLVIEHKKQT